MLSLAWGTTELRVLHLDTLSRESTRQVHARVDDFAQQLAQDAGAADAAHNNVLLEVHAAGTKAAVRSAAVEQEAGAKSVLRRDVVAPSGLIETGAHAQVACPATAVCVELKAFGKCEDATPEPGFLPFTGALLHSAGSCPGRATCCHCDGDCDRARAEAAARERAQGLALDQVRRAARASFGPRDLLAPAPNDGWMRDMLGQHQLRALQGAGHEDADVGSEPEVDDSTKTVTISAVGPKGQQKYYDDMRFSKAELDGLALAEGSGLGYKTSNLVLLDRLAKADAYGWKVQVPLFLGLPHAAMLRFCREVLELDIEADWQRHKAAADGPMTAEQLHAAAADIKAKLQAKFTALGDTVSVFDAAERAPTLREWFPDEATALEQILVDVKTARRRLIVRSTGREDTEDVANAGGNDSKPNVKTNLASLLDGIATVMTSYFGAKSFGQRIMAGDPTLQDFPLCPVLVMEMVGDSTDAKPEEVYRSGVLYTREPDMEPGPNFNRIQASFGHNEGVVNSKVQVDTYRAYIGGGAGEGVVYSQVVHKPQRLSPDLVHETLAMVDNPPALAKAPALTLPMVHTLAKFSERVHKFYGGRSNRDIEYTVDPVSRVVYIVQCRPLQRPQKESAPSYLPRVPAHAQQVSTLVPATAAVLTVQQKNLLAAPNLQVALKMYEDRVHDGTGGEVLAVLTATRAPSTSHEAVEFRNRGVAVAYAKAALVAQVEQWNPSDRYALDVQREVLAPVGPHPPVPIDGWLVYPMSPELSVQEALIEDVPVVPIARSVEKRAMSTEVFDALVAVREGLHQGTTQGLFDASGDVDRTMPVLRALEHLAGLDAFVAAAVASPRLATDATMAALLVRLQAQWRQAATLVEEALALGHHSDLLFGCRVLEALLYQDGPSSRTADGWSLNRLLRVVEAEGRAKIGLEQLHETRQNDAQALADLYAADLARVPRQFRAMPQFILPHVPTVPRDPPAVSATALQLAKLAELCFRQARGTIDGLPAHFAAVNWLRFVVELDTDPTLRGEVVEALFELNSLEMLQVWMNLAFRQGRFRVAMPLAARVRAFNSGQDTDPLPRARDVARDLKQDLAASDDLSALATRIRQRMRSLNPMDFAEPGSIRRASAHAGLIFADVKQVPVLWADSGPIGRVAALSALQQFVEHYDHCLKAFKGSAAVRDAPGAEKAFADLLEPNAEMLDTLIPLLVDPVYRSGVCRQEDCDNGNRYCSYAQGYCQAVLQPPTLLASVYQLFGEAEFDVGARLMFLLRRDVDRVAPLRPQDLWGSAEGFSVDRISYLSGALWSLPDGNPYLGYFVKDNRHGAAPGAWINKTADHAPVNHLHTLEDTFTILHQSLSRVLGHGLMVTAGLEHMERPRAVEHLLEGLLKGSERVDGVDVAKPSLAGVERTDEGFVFRLNQPLNMHGAQYLVQFASDGVTVQLSMYGSNQLCRWPYFTKLLHDAGDYVGGDVARSQPVVPHAVGVTAGYALRPGATDDPPPTSQVYRLGEVLSMIAASTWVDMDPEEFEARERKVRPLLYENGQARPALRSADQPSLLKRAPSLATTGRPSLAWCYDHKVELGITEV